MQKIVKFWVNDDAPIDEQIQDYLDDNSDETIVTLTTVNNKGDEVVIAVVDDGQ